MSEPFTLYYDGRGRLKDAKYACVFLPNGPSYLKKA